jgi:hypothetical protein
VKQTATTSQNKVQQQTAVVRALFCLLSVLFVSTLVACSQDKLQPLNQAEDIVVGYAAVEAHICTQPPSPALQNLKYVFILDHSASNQPGFPSPLTPGDVSATDPAGARRYGPLVNFLNTLVSDPNTVTSFALIDFNDTAQQIGATAGFDTSQSDFIQTVTTDWIGGGTALAPAPNDSGFTNYQAALLNAYQLIHTDIQAQAAVPTEPVVTTQYVIIFVSDGVPTVATPTGANPTYTQTFSTDISPVINNIMNLKNDPVLGPFIANITMNTAYYSNGTQLVGAVQLLEQMANAGNGQYLEFDSGANILYQQFAPPSRDLRNQLVDVFVDNTNAVWTSDGQFALDSDGNGFPDYLKRQFGANVNLADSDGNGVSDLVEYLTKGKPCDAANCAATGRDPYAICDGFSPVTHPDGTVTFSSSTNDGLNDCEKFLLGADRNTYNSNGDLIPDHYALKSGLPVIPGSSGTAFSDPFSNGLNNYTKVKDGYPVQVSLNTVSGFFDGRVTTLVQETSSSPNTDCYHLTVSQIALAGSNDKFNVMLVQNPAGVLNKPFLVQASGYSGGPGGVLKLQPSDFK